MDIYVERRVGKEGRKERREGREEHLVMEWKQVFGCKQLVLILIIKTTTTTTMTRTRTSLIIHCNYIFIIH
jgi:hypothetical protein